MIKFDLLSIILLVYGLYILFGITFKPNFYWESRRIKRSREVLGDKWTIWIYVGTGIVMLAIAYWGMFRG